MSTPATTSVAEALGLLDFDLVTQIAVPGSRLAIAALLAGVIGLTRERVREAAGLRTHIIVGLAAAAIVGGTHMDSMGNDDRSRVVQGILQGVGFLGAGTIIQRGGARGGGARPDHRGFDLAGRSRRCAGGLGQPIVAALATLVAWVVLVPMKAFEDSLAARAIKEAAEATRPPGDGPPPSAAP
jgi:putative Mg2+ transporter-C (MgtC) family protein